MKTNKIPYFLYKLGLLESLTFKSYYVTNKHQREVLLKVLKMRCEDGQ